MRVVQISGIDPRSTRPGGTRTYVLSLMKQLKEQGIDAMLVGASYPHSTGKCKYKFLGMRMKKASSLSFLYRLFMEVPYMKLSRRDVLHFHRPEDVLPFMFYWPRNPKVITFHGIPRKGIKQRNGAIIDFLYSIIEQEVVGHVEGVIPVSEEGKEFLIGNHGISPTVIPVGVDTEKFTLKADKTDKEKGGRGRVLFVGRFEKEKGIDHLVRLASEVELVAVGDGPLRRNLEQAGVEVLGKVSNEKMPEAYADADLLVLPSSYEGLPTVVLEALSCGVPVVAFDVGDVSKVVDDTVGRISSANTFVQDVQDVLSDLPEREVCRKKAEQFSWKLVGECVLNVYKELE